MFDPNTTIVIILFLIIVSLVWLWAYVADLYNTYKQSEKVLESRIVHLEEAVIQIQHLVQRYTEANGITKKNRTMWDKE